MFHRTGWPRRFLDSAVSRRKLLKLSTMGAAAVVGPGLDAAGALRGAGNEPLHSPGVHQTTGEEQVLFHDGIYGDPSSFDWNLDPSCGAEEAAFAGLLAFDENLKPVPDWAERYESNADASAWTFHIRPNNRGWTDGHPVTAHDFVWSWTRLLNPNNGSAHASFLFDIKYAQQYNTNTPVDDPNDPLNGHAPTDADLGIKALDDWTLEVATAGPCAYFPAIAASQEAVPAPRWQVEQYGGAWAKGGEIPIVSNGPFKVDAWEHDVSIALSRNRDYWDGDHVRLARVVVPILTAGQNIDLYQDGSEDRRLDWTRLDAPQYERALAEPELSSQIQPYVDQRIWMLRPQVTIAPFDLLVVRRAISQAIDRESMASATGELAVPAWCMAPPGMFGYLDEPSLQEIQSFDPQQALALLDGTPYEDGEGWPDITMYMPDDEDDAIAETVANEIVAQLKEHLGMDVAIQVVAPSDFSAELQTLTWPLVLAPWRYQRADPHNGYGDLFYSRKASGQRQAWANAEFDDLVEAGRAEPDQAKRLDIYLQAERIIQEDVGYMPLVYRQDQNVFKPWVKGVPVNANGYTVPDGRFFVRMLTKTYVEGHPAELSAMPSSS